MSGRRFFAVLLLALPLAVLLGCSQADSLGDAAPTTVHIVGQPTWSNGISALMDLKCAVCHQQPVPEVAPGNTPRDLDLRRFDLAGTVRGAQDVLPFLLAGLLANDVLVFPHMPPDFGTPLVSEELAALTTWAAATPLPDVAGGTSVADGLLLYAANCQGCHGVGGAGGPYIAVAGSDPVANATVLQFALGAVPEMVNWPGLASLSTSDQQAIANYLAAP